MANKISIGIEEERKKRIGDLYINENNDVYILSRVALTPKTLYSLIDLDDGDRWGDPNASLEDLFSSSEWTRITRPVTLIPRD